MKLYKTKYGILVNHLDSFYKIDEDWNILINHDDLYNYLLDITQRAEKVAMDRVTLWLEEEIMAPIGKQEVWAAGVTYLRSREARMEESESSGAADLYDKVYSAERPELFFKALPHRVAGHKEHVHIRRDSTWNVPEPELTLFINSKGKIRAYTVGNDMSSRSIEGENALYLPQAKVYERSASLGPCLYVPPAPIALTTMIEMCIHRNGKEVYRDSVCIDRIKRSFTELAEYTFRECDFPYGCFLMTGTCLVPPNEFTLQEGDIVDISIDHIGTLSNTIRHKPNPGI